MKPIEQQLLEWAQKSELRIEAVMKTALQDMTGDMQTPTAKGGRMPVLTGFLRNSAGSAINEVPAGGSADAVPVVINRLKIGDQFVFGWAANYGKYMNNRYGFLDLPVQDFRSYVFRAIQKVKE